MTYDKDSFLAGLSVGMSLRYSKRIPAQNSYVTYATFSITTNLTQQVYFTQSQANGIVIRWGDGSAPETVASLSATASHTYASAGTYVVTFTATNGASWYPGLGTQTGFCGPTHSSDFPPTRQEYRTLVDFRFGLGCTLGSHSFVGCAALNEVIVPSWITSIPEYCFFNCVSLKTISIPDSVSSFGSYAFSYCSNLISVYIPSGVTEIPHSCFSNCTNLSFNSIPQNIQVIGTTAFEYCSSITISIIPSTVQTVRSNAFRYCDSITHIEIACKTLGYTDGTHSYSYAFSHCPNLVSAWLRSSINTIYADSSTSVGGSPFWGCDNLNTVYCEPISKPSGWGVNFARGKSVVYGQTTRPW